MKSMRGKAAVWFVVAGALFAGSSAALPEFTQVFHGSLDGAYSFIYNGGQSESSPALGDTDKDGDLDLAVACSNGVAYFRNDGTPYWPVWTFVSKSILPEITAGEHLARAEMCDIDGDGDDDLFVTPWNGKVMFYRSECGVFDLVTEQFVQLPYSPLNSTSIAFGDLDGDGLPDMLIGKGPGHGGSASDAGTVFYYHNEGFVDGYTEYPKMQLVGNTIGLDLRPQDTAEVELVDLDGDPDHKLDALVGTWGVFSGSRDVRGVYRFDNDGTPSSPHFTLVDTNYLDVRSMTAYIPAPETGDLDGDGYPDLFFGERSTGAITGIFGYFKNRGVPGPAAWTAGHDPLAQFTHASGPSTYDIDADGDLDLFTGEVDTNATVKFYENVGSPTSPVWKTRSQDVLGSAITGYVVVSPEVCDIDGDGKAEMLVSCDGQMQASVYLVENTGTEQAPSWDTAHITTLPGVSSSARHPDLDTGDFDRDGLLDVVMSGPPEGSNAIVWYRNRTEGGVLAFDAPAVLCTGVPPGSGPWNCSRPAFSDVDNDGDLDLFVGSDYIMYESSAAYINFFENKNGVFGSAPDILNVAPYTMMGAEAFVTAADLNGDGWDDLLCSDWSGGLIHLRQRGATLALTPPALTVAPGETVTLQALDAAGNPVAAEGLEWSFTQNRTDGRQLTPEAGPTAAARYTAGTTPGVLDVVQLRPPAGTAGGPVGRAYINVVDPAAAAYPDRAVILAGLGGAADDQQWPERDGMSGQAYRTCRFKGLGRAQISFLSDDPARDIDGNGQPDDIDGVASAAALLAAIDATPPETPRLTVYLAGPAPETGGLYAAPGDPIAPAILDEHLDSLQQAGNCRVTVIVEADSAQAFLAALAPPPGKERNVLVATSTGEKAWLREQGGESFSAAFWGGIYGGLTVGEAFQKAFASVIAHQTPRMDDTGDGLFDRGADGNLAVVTHVGLPNIAGPDQPQIGTVAGNATLEWSDSGSLTLWAGDVTSGAPTDGAFAEVVPSQPASKALRAFGARAGSSADAVRVPLTRNPATQRYEAAFDGFNREGSYTVLFYAKDIWGNLSLPKQIRVERLGTPDSDGDGLSDAEEDVNGNGAVDPGELDPHDADSDNDGLDDGAEAAYDGDAATYNPYDPLTNPGGTDLNATRPDTDGDGVSDARELLWGHDPLDALDVPDLAALTGTGLFLLGVLLAAAMAVALRRPRGAA